MRGGGLVAGLGLGCMLLLPACSARGTKYVDPQGRYELRLPDGWSGGELDPRLKQPLFKGPTGSFVVIYNVNPGPRSELTPETVMSYLESGLRSGGDAVEQLVRHEFEGAGRGQIAAYRVPGSPGPLPFIACIVFEQSIVQVVGAVPEQQNVEIVRDVLATLRPLATGGATT